MDFTPNKNNPQKIQFNNQVSALAISHYLKDHTFMDWKKMTQVWLNGYTTNKNDYNYSSGYGSQKSYQVTPNPRPNGGFWGGGGHGSPANYTNTIQFLLDHGLATFSKINGFKVFASTQKLKNLSTYGLAKICLGSNLSKAYAPINNTQNVSIY